MKGTILPDKIPLNKFRLIIPGLPPITILSVGGMDLELDSVDYPDRTSGSGGRTKPVEFEVEVPLHHALDVASMHFWFIEGQDPVSPTYKKFPTLIAMSESNLQIKAWLLPGCWCMSEGTPDFKVEDEGKMATMKYKLKADDRLPLS